MELSVSKLLQSGRRLRQALEGRAIVLVYHRVADLASDPWQMAVTPAHFNEQMQILSRRCHPLPLSTLVPVLAEGQLPGRAVFITFDDGYADVLHQAQPVLTQYKIPSTVFLTACAVNSPREFWWDELEGIFLTPGVLPRHLGIDIQGKLYQREMRDAVQYQEADLLRHRGWKPKLPPPTSRHAAFADLWKLLHPLPDAERREVLDELHAWSQTSAESREEYRTLTKAEAVRLSGEPLVEIGSHSLTHPRLSGLPFEDQQKEIRASKTMLEDLTGHPVRAFSYPYGKIADYTPDSVSIVKEAGYDYACTNFPGCIFKSSDPFQCPRMYVADWDGDLFASMLESWFSRFYGIWKA